MKHIIFGLFAALFLLFSCSRSVATSSSETYSESKKSEVSAVKEIAKAVAESTTEKRTNFGDTLKASVHFDVSELKDSGTSLSKRVESSGIELTANIEKTSSGFNVNFETIAKPTSNLERTVERRDIERDISKVDNVRSDSTHQERQDTKKKYHSPPLRGVSSGGFYCCLS